jgi:hypothetical protein
MPEERKPVCEYCQSTLTVKLGNETHCNSCGRSWGLDLNPISTHAADRKRLASASTGFNPHRHDSEGLADLEAQLNQADREFSKAVMDVASHRGADREELSRLRQIERDAKRKLDRLLEIRGELATQKSVSWPQR